MRRAIQKFWRLNAPLDYATTKEPVFKSIMEQPHYYAQLQIEMVCADKFNADFLSMVTIWDALESFRDDIYLLKNLF